MIMNTLLITAMFASMLGSNNIGAQTDTINRYMVDGKLVYNFDGSQLESKMILSYDIKVEPETKGKDKGTVLRTHDIKTADGALIYDDPNVNIGQAKVSVRYVDPNQEKPLFIVDGKEFSSIDDLDPANIKSMTVLKDKAATDLYGEKGKNGVVVVETKK